MKITVLGSGSAYGTPMMFNFWGASNPDNSKNKRSRASIFLQEKNINILVDAGPDFREQINKNNIQNVDAVFLTHGHYDHIAGVPELPRACKLLSHPIEVFAGEQTMGELKTCYGYLFKAKADAEPNSKDLRWNLIPDDGDFNACGLSFKTLAFPHHKLRSAAFRYNNFAYVTDWQALPQNSETFLSGLDLLLIECNNGTDFEDNGHSNLNSVLEVIKKFQPKKVVLTHLSSRIDFDEFSKLLPHNCQLAYDGLCLEI